MGPRMIMLGFCIGMVIGAHGSHTVLKSVGPQVSDIHIECNSNNIMVTVSIPNEFSGMIYPKGLSSNSTCLEEFEHVNNGEVRYKLPLRSCNTMTKETTEGVVEYFNTVVIEPHNRLVTNQGKGFKVKCRYSSNTLETSDKNSNSVGVPPVMPHPLPNCHMKIFIGRPDNHLVAQHVKVGDYITLVINIDEQDIFGIKVTNCIVKDGMALSEQPLINNEGCPIDEEIFGHFEYSKDLTSALVTYPAHKFPVTASVYYSCNVKLCYKKTGGCDDVPPICDGIGNNVRRRRRRRQSGVEDSGNLNELRLQDEDVRDRSVEVFSGLYVNEVDESEESDAPSSLATQNDDEFCVSTRKFAIGISIGGVLLMLAVILLVACIVHRRRRRKGSSTSGSSIYSGPYSNHAYSRD